MLLLLWPHRYGAAPAPLLVKWQAEVCAIAGASSEACAVSSWNAEQLQVPAFVDEKLLP